MFLSVLSMSGSRSNGSLHSTRTKPVYECEYVSTSRSVAQSPERLTQYDGSLSELHLDFQVALTEWQKDVDDLVQRGLCQVINIIGDRHQGA